LRRLWADPAWAGALFLCLGRDRAKLEALRDAAAGAGADLAFVPCDLGERGSAVRAWESLGAPPLKGLFLGAGAAWDKPLRSQSEAEFETCLRVNFSSHAQLLERLDRPQALLEGARGVLVGSYAAVSGRAGQCAYATAKAALEGLLAGSPAGLRLNLLLPPLMPSPMLDVLSPEARGRLFAECWMEDPDPVASCAEAAAFLLGEGSAYLHRRTLHADSRVGSLGWA